MDDLELFARAAAHRDRVAIRDDDGAHTYGDLLEQSARIGRTLGALCDEPAATERSGRHEGPRRAEDTPGRPAAPRFGSADGPRIAYLVAPGFDHAAVQWGIWRAGAVAVPLSAMQAPAEWSYVIGDTEAAVVVVDASIAVSVREAAGEARVVTTEELAGHEARSDRGRAPRRSSFRERQTSNGLPLETRGANEARLIEAVGMNGRRPTNAGALILYTSGTTGKPKGVVLTHANIEAQVRCLVAAWEWRSDDRILHALPLNHVHGIVNVLTCALWAGATCEMLPRFDPSAVWNAIAAARLTLFMAVPTIYTKLIAAWESAPPPRQRAMSSGCRAMRLMVSGSAALPVRVLEKWREISGHTLLERYGMTEIGMALSNPLKAERRAGSVGIPLPGVEVQIVGEEGRPVAPGSAGELEVRGPGVFREYWRSSEATEAAFRDGWFRTGDVAVFESGMYRLLGRQSVDIIKCGGYKVSALEIEEVLREHPGVGECAVVGLDDPEWGERIAVAVVPRAPGAIDIEGLREWARPRLARYKLPTRLVLVPDLPRNAMGKVSKPAVKRLFTDL